MDYVFPIPPPIIVPDGTELHEIIGPRVLSELGFRMNDGVSVALGRLPGGILSKVHVHPVVWHFTWVRHGELTVMMKDPTSDAPYRLTVPTDHGVLTEAGTFFQLRNETDSSCEVYYIVGPAFVFEADTSGVRYNDAVVFEHSWEELAEFDWKPPELPHPQQQDTARHASLQRQATGRDLSLVRPERWTLKNGPGSVSVPSVVHKVLVAKTPASSLVEPMAPKQPAAPTSRIMEMAEQYLDFLTAHVGLTVEKTYRRYEQARIVSLQCNREPSALSEYALAESLLSLASEYIHPDEIWHLLMFGLHDDLVEDNGGSALLRARFHVFDQLLTFATTIGGGFASAGTMENYRGYTGGVYSDPDSYRHYIRE